MVSNYLSSLANTSERNRKFLMKSKSNRTIYIAGPMRGYEQFNFPAFDRARDKALSLGFEKVISPADMDREDGEYLTYNKRPEEVQRIYARRDLEAIFTCTHVAMLPGWEKSIGAKAEYCM